MSVATALSELARWLRLETINFRRKAQLCDVIGAAQKSTSSTEPLGGECPLEFREDHFAEVIAPEVDEEIHPEALLQKWNEAIPRERVRTM